MSEFFTDFFRGAADLPETVVLFSNLVFLLFVLLVFL